MCGAPTLVGPTTFPSRDWPTAPPVPPSPPPPPTPRRPTPNCHKNLIKAPLLSSELGRAEQTQQSLALFLSCSLCVLHLLQLLLLSCNYHTFVQLHRLKLNATQLKEEEEGGGGEDGGGDAGGRPLLRGAQQEDIAPHHRRRRGRLRRRAVPRRRAPPGILARAPRAAGRVDVGATGLHVVPPRRQLRRRHQRQHEQRRRRWQGVAAAAAVRQQGHRRLHPPVLTRLGALQEEGQEVERL